MEKHAMGPLPYCVECAGFSYHVYQLVKLSSFYDQLQGFQSSLQHRANLLYQPKSLVLMLLPQQMAKQIGLFTTDL